MGVKVPASLPYLQDVGVTRNEREIGDRLMCMHAAAACAYGFDRSSALRWLMDEALLDQLSAAELSFVRDGMGEARALQEQIEGMWALAWTVSLQDSIDFSAGCSDGFFLLLPNLRQLQSSVDVRARMRRRRTEEVVEALDLAYCLHWIVRDAELADRRSRLHIPPYIIVERRRGLEWVMSERSWDDVPLDT